MNFKTTIILFVLLAVVGGVVYFTNNGEKKADQTPSNPTGESGRKLVDLSADHVNQVTITDSAGKRTTLLKDGASWKLTEPVAAGAEEYSVHDLISTLTGLQSQGTPDTTSGLDTGLDKPRYTVSLSSDDGKTTVIDIGDKTGVGDVMYAKVEGDSEIDLVPSTIDKTLKTAADDVRDKHLVTAKDGTIQQVQIEYGGKTVALEKLMGKWEILTAGGMMPGDETAISSLLFSITGMQATEFIKPDSDDLIGSPFKYQTMKVWFSTQAPATQPSTSEPANSAGTTITFGAPADATKDHYFVETSDGLIAKVDKYSFDGLHKSPLELRDKNVASVVPDDVTQIAITKQTFAPAATQPTTAASTLPTLPPVLLSSNTVVLVKRPPVAPVLGPSFPTTNPTTMASTQPTTNPAAQASVWQFEGDAKTQVDDSKVSAMLGKFSPLQADKFDETSPAAQPITHYLVEMTTKQSGGGMTAVYKFEFSVYPDTQSPTGVYNGTVFELPKTTTDTLDVDFKK